MTRWMPALFVCLLLTGVTYGQDAPKAADPRLVVELVAASPDIVHPVSCDFDAKGRLLVIESHTHFAPKDYKGPKFDRIRKFDVSKPGNKPTTFYEGTRHTMDLAVHPDGSVYLATRNEILRLRDTKGTGVADEKTRIVFLDTKGDYPHNGLSGLCFDSKGDLIFGMGENLGAKYTLIGADGVKFSGEGDGGHIFHCSADGKKLRRIATGFWNPFGNCRDIYGRLFCVDNDPDQAPPCRMLHVVEGGDYGFMFRYGRSGKHPFQSWHGTLPGTLPMMTGVGEAPCEILSYESDGLPKEYLGKLMVTSWADHRVELYKVKPHGASFKADREPFLQGGNNFRPVGLCTAPDGSLYVTDWVLPNYNLHGKGAIWRVRWKDAPKVERPADPMKAILSMHRPLREAAAEKLASEENGSRFLARLAKNDDPRVRAAAYSALVGSGHKFLSWYTVARDDADLGLRELAVRALVHRRDSVGKYWEAGNPENVRAEAIRGMVFRRPEPSLELLAAKDPFLRHAYIDQFARDQHIFASRFDLKDGRFGPFDAKQRVGMLLIQRKVSQSLATRDAVKLLANYFDDSDEDVRFLAAKWIADEKLEDFRGRVLNAMADPKLSVRMYTAYATALARLDGKNIDERGLADYFAKRLDDDATPAALRAMLLRQVPTTHSKLTIKLLAKLLKSDDAALKFEAVRALVDHPDSKPSNELAAIFRNEKEPSSLRRFAMLGLDARDFEDVFREVSGNKKSPLQEEAGEALLFKFNKGRTVEPEKDRPPAKNLDAWLKRLEGKADAEAGARVFFHPRLAACYRCHRIDGRGQDVGPDLSGIGNTDRRHLLESILQPSNTVAPHYVAWHLETADGKVRNGMLLHTNLDEYTYLDAKGEKFKVRTSDLVEQRPLTTSIMPDGLQDRMTDQEMRDLLAYLQTRK